MSNEEILCNSGAVQLVQKEAVGIIMRIIKSMILCIFLLSTKGVYADYFGVVDLDGTFEEEISSDCSIIFQSQDTMDGDAFSVGKGFAWSVIDLLGFVGPVGTLSATAGHFVEAMQATESSSSSENNERIQWAFDQSWQCTKRYIDAQVGAGLIDSQSGESRIISRLQDVQGMMAYIVDDSYREKYYDCNDMDSTECKLHIFDELVIGKLNDLSNADPFEEVSNNLSPLKCRPYMNELTQVISYFHFAYKLYIDDSASSPSDRFVDTTVRFRAYLGDLLQLFQDCAPYALYDVLANSEERSLTYISAELGIIYDGAAFCNWVEITKQHWDPEGDEPYIFGILDFSYWDSDSCSATKWISYVNEVACAYAESQGDDRFSEYEMVISDLWPDSIANQIDNIPYLQVYHENADGEDYVRDTWITHDCDDDREQWASELYDYTGFEWARATSVEFLPVRGSGYGHYKTATLQKNTFIADGCANKATQCYPDALPIETVEHSCPADGSYLSAARYLVYDDSSWDYGNGGLKKTRWDWSGSSFFRIGGLELACSNPKKYEAPTKYYNSNFSTAFRQLSPGYTDEYHWSPWYVCPIGYYLDMKIIAMTGCRYKNTYHYGSYDTTYETLSTDQKVIFKCVKSEIGVYGINFFRGDSPMNIQSYNGRCLSVDTGFGSGVQLSECNSEAKSQQFYLTLYNAIKSVKNGKCLEFDIDEDILDYDSAELQMMDCTYDTTDTTDTSNQKWTVDLGFDTQRIRSTNHQEWCLEESKYEVTLSRGEAEMTDDNELVIYTLQRWNIYSTLNAHVYKDDDSCISIGWSVVPMTGYSMSDVSAASDGTVFAITSDMKMFKRSSNAWSLVTEQPFVQVSVGSESHIWAIDDNGRAYKYGKKISGYFEDFSSIKCELYGQCFKDISVGSDGTVYAVTNDNAINRRTYGGKYFPVWQWKLQKSWIISDISVGSSTDIWGITWNGRAYGGMFNAWHGCSGGNGGSGTCFKQVSVGNDGTVIAINTDNKAYWWGNDGTWHAICGGLSHISVGDADNIWGISGNVWGMKQVVQATNSGAFSSFL